MNAEPTCQVATTASADEWRVRGAVLRMELRRHDLTHRELQLAELILDKTYGWCRPDVVFPQLRFFTDLTGIGAPDVVKVLKSLHARRIIHIITVKGRPTYSIHPDTESWKAMPRVSRATMQSTINLMREHNGLEPLHLEQEAALNFKDRADAKNLDAEIGELPMSQPIASLTCEFPNLL